MIDDLSFSVNVPADQIETLLPILRDVAADVQIAPSKELDWQTVVVIMEGVGKVAGGITAVMILAEKLNAWRKALRQQGRTPEGRLKRPGQPTLDLATATDQEVLEWLIATPPVK
ncbi:MAG: hypothetical protein HXY39_15655 [Chloroflexi bacterium]|nr:hypothetical protein [Chloroflexota bacterium]